MAIVILFTVTLGNATIGFDFDLFCSHSILFETGVTFHRTQLQQPRCCLRLCSGRERSLNRGTSVWLLPFPPQRYQKNQMKLVLRKRMLLGGRHPYLMSRSGLNLLLVFSPQPAFQVPCLFLFLVVYSTLSTLSLERQVGSQ